VKPDPSFPRTGGQPGAFKSYGPWQAKHSPIPLTRYRPRVSRSEVRWNLRSFNERILTVAFDEAGESAAELARPLPSTERQPEVSVSDAISKHAIPSIALASASPGDRDNIEFSIEAEDLYALSNPFCDSEAWKIGCSTS